MSTIQFDEKSVLDAKNKFNSYNNTILNALKTIDKEIEDMPRILNTPRIKQSYEEIMNYFDEKISFVDNSNKLFNKRFNTVFTEYMDFNEDVKKMVGGRNDK